MKVLKNNFYDIVRLYVNQIGILIFSLFLGTAVAFIGEESTSNLLSILVSIASMLFYYVLIYFVMWEIGAKDKIKIDGGKMEPCKKKGLIMGAFANIPNLLINGLCFIGALIAMLTSVQGFVDFSGIMYAIMKLHGGLYLGLIYNGIVANLGLGAIQTIVVEAALFIVIPMFSVLITHFAYSMGSRDKRIIDIFKGKNK